jgi:hypothetical protein
MKALLGITFVALAAGCATTAENTQLAQAECKVVPMKPGYISGTSPKPAREPLDQTTAELQLASSDYRFRQLSRYGIGNNNIEDALRDCDRASAMR